MHPRSTLRSHMLFRAITLIGICLLIVRKLSRWPTRAIGPMSPRPVRLRGDVAIDLRSLKRVISTDPPAPPDRVQPAGLRDHDDAVATVTAPAPEAPHT